MQTWCFGDDLAMVFLGGEVVVDYSIRLNDMFDSDRLWINAYSNDVPCYIASARFFVKADTNAIRRCCIIAGQLDWLRRPKM